MWTVTWLGIVEGAAQGEGLGGGQADPGPDEVEPRRRADAERRRGQHAGGDLGEQQVAQAGPDVQRRRGQPDPQTGAVLLDLDPVDGVLGRLAASSSRPGRPATGTAPRRRSARSCPRASRSRFRAPDRWPSARRRSSSQKNSLQPGGCRSRPLKPAGWRWYQSATPIEEVLGRLAGPLRLLDRLVELCGRPAGPCCSARCTAGPACNRCRGW